MTSNISKISTTIATAIPAMGTPPSSVSVPLVSVGVDRGVLEAVMTGVCVVCCTVRVLLIPVGRGVLEALMTEVCVLLIIYCVELVHSTSK